MFPAVGPFDPLDGLSREELRQRLQSLQALIAQAPVPIAIAHDPDCRFISANRALAALLRMPDDANISLTPPPGDDAALPDPAERPGHPAAASCRCSTPSRTATR